MKEKSLMNLDSQQKTGMSSRLKYLREKLSQIPHKPGVYLHKNEFGEILYVGKAKDLVNRLKSYFYGIENHSPKTKALVLKIYDFEIIITENEYESLLLENNLIKHNKPNYNILLRDDKTYPYIKIDIQEEWPKVTVVRKRKKDGSLYFGPYTLTGQVIQLMNLINRFFPLVKCTPTVFKTVTRPCNYYDIKKCLGPCKLTVDKKEYESHLNNVIAILNGKSKDILTKIKKEMLLSADALNFEKAAMLRDQLKAVSQLTENQSVTLSEEIDIDILGSYWSKDIAAFYVAQIRSGKVIGGDSYIIRHITEEPSEDGKYDNTQDEMQRIYSAFVCQYYSQKNVPENIIFSNAENVINSENFLMIEKYLNEKFGKNENNSKKILHLNKNIFTKSLKSKDKILPKKIENLVLHANKNAENKYSEHIKMEEVSNNLLMALKEFLKLSTIPLIIECFDISTFQGSETVASQVVFKNGKPSKSSYRKYIIKSVIGQDDFASLREVIRRRFKDRNNIQIPNVLLIDGGTPQIREVGWMLKGLGLEHINFLGLAKSRNEKNFKSAIVTASEERIVIPARGVNGELLPDVPPETRILQQGSAEFKLLTQIRDEAHRFAITFHRQRRDKNSLKSILYEIKGLGAKRKKKLLETYPNLKDIIHLNLKEISDTTKIPLNVIQQIVEKLKS
ncbi:excinuclease ABC subunit UvrC [Pigmentibacter sp. JX0631]|uniref:excinuclease ABC subunit UvrC n=1 Tax=Pigmentibacter sp. JX0631 TaxID=2976982 RepID=UPI002468860F|nr:excinuclease ABC subunit UvrC [Pigmentibacter sp. JX0631]WGL60724.1 excinuclease ABC subunit UvrC [Pigmentibacter sp. JX0631]